MQLRKERENTEKDQRSQRRVIEKDTWLRKEGRRKRRDGVLNPPPSAVSRTSMLPMPAARCLMTLQELPPSSLSALLKENRTSSNFSLLCLRAKKKMIEVRARLKAIQTSNDVSEQQNILLSN